MYKYEFYSKYDSTKLVFKGDSLRCADLRDANIYRTSLAEADLRGADLRGADLTGADLAGADLRGVDLAGADLTWANFLEKDLKNIGLREANSLEKAKRRAKELGHKEMIAYLDYKSVGDIFKVYSWKGGEYTCVEVVHDNSKGEE